MTAMPFRTIVVHADDDRHANARIELAARIAGWSSGHLVVLHTPGARAASTDDAAAEARRLAAAARISCDWVAVSAGSTPTFVARARAADLVVIGPWGQRPSGSIDTFAAEVVLGTGRPVLVVPAVGSSLAFPEHALIAWNGTRESARSIADAGPLLARARRVTLLTDADPQDAVTADLMTMLARHHIIATRRALDGAGGDTGTRILTACREEHADLLVIGAYGHPSADELVEGGVTQTMLDTAALPVLMSH